MKWIVVAILVVIIPYTWITLHYRKPGKPFEPYADMKDRANTMRLLSAGFQRIAVVADRPAEPKSFPTTLVTPARGGLPSELASTLVEPPMLPGNISHATAAGSVDAAKPYSIQFVCDVPDDHQQLGGALVYVKGEDLFVVPTFERLGHGLLSRTRDTTVLLALPGGALKPGHYRATLIGAQVSQMWSFDVN